MPMPLLTATTARLSLVPVEPSPAASGAATALKLRPRRAWLPRSADAECGCGWFESSRALREGLEVIEWDCEPLLLWVCDA